MERNGTDDLAGNYIEVSLDSQHLWLYKDGALVTETDIVSGAPTPERETYRGAWPIAYKASPFTLSSEEYGYAETVKYWMPFAGDVGMHDASWRKSFGGNIYKTNGSHGCINLPTSVAKTIYNTIEKGWPVLVYTLPGTESAAQLQQDVQTVIDLINSIGEVTADSETVISSARSQYDALPDSTKANVTNYDVLVAAEASLAQIKAAGEQMGM